MNRIPSIRLVLVVTALTALLTVPAAGARGLERPRSGAGVEAGWFGAAMRWLEGITGLRPAPRAGRSLAKEDPVIVPVPDGPGDPLSGGSCIDPQGNPRPMCGIDG